MLTDWTPRSEEESKMPPSFLAGDLGDKGAQVETEVMNSGYDTPEERHLGEEIYVMEVKGLETGSEDQNQNLNKFKQITSEVTQQSISWIKANLPIWNTFEREFI